MSLKVGIVGLPNVGKSTLFNALTKSAVPAENYPFCTIDPSIGAVAVPDNRLQTLSTLSKSEKEIPAMVEFVDIAGLVEGASSGEGLGNEFLSHIREVDMIAEVVRIFDDSDVHHVSGAVDPLSDIEVINLELILTDAQTVAKRLQNVQRDANRGDKTAIADADLLTRLLQTLESGRMAHTLPFDQDELMKVTSLHLLTMKPILYVFNKKNGAFNFDENNDPRWIELMEFVESSEAEFVMVDAGIEHELKDLAEDDKLEFRREYGTLDSGINTLISSCYTALGLMSFYTTGEKESRAWTIPKGATAPEAGAVIHSDFKEKFIRAHIVSFDDLVGLGSFAKAREEGRLRTEGKEYVVKDGDVIEFMHS